MALKLNVLMVSAEVAPFAKTGGLGDVVGSLPPALADLGVHVDVVMPLYHMIKDNETPIHDLKKSISVNIAGRSLKAGIWRAELAENTSVYLVDNTDFYDRENFYGSYAGDYDDNLARFSFLCLSAIELCRALHLTPHVIHCHDWHTALLPAYLRTTFRSDPVLGKAASLFTIHNLAYQGQFHKSQFPHTGLPEYMNHAGGLEIWGNINFMKAGILFSEILNTVSPTYSKEIQTKEFGFGLEGLLASRSDDLYGIINGADYHIWDPEIDPLIPSTYHPGDLQGKLTCKQNLLSMMKMDPALASRPVFGLVSRLETQKGIDILELVVPEIIDQNAGFVLLGSGKTQYEDFFKHIAKKYPGKTGIRIMYDDRLAHQIIAGSDVLLMPSMFEPCGLTQIYAMKYGTVPIIRATGGLADTVKQFDQAKESGNGLVFYEYSPNALRKAVTKALNLYDNKEAWNILMLNAMQSSFTWRESARKYISLYEKAIARKRGGIRMPPGTFRDWRLTA
jgi:starch synthase